MPRYTDKLHQDPVQQVIGRTDPWLESGKKFETIHPNQTEPWNVPIGLVKNVGLRKEEVAQVVKTRVAEKTKVGSLVIFRDGLYLPDTGGGAAIAYNGKTKIESFSANLISN